MLYFEKVQKHYGSFAALDIPSLGLDKGLWWLQGENGSGKTTFMKMIAGLHPFKGDILLEGYNINKGRQQFIKQISYSEAEPLYPLFLTAKDLITLYCKTKCGSMVDAEEHLRQLHVFDAYTQKLGTYSSGMIKKLSLALAFIGSPKVILLDEPLITIDAAAIETICTIIRGRLEEGVSFIITSHQSIPAQQLTFTGTLKAENRTITIVSE